MKVQILARVAKYTNNSCLVRDGWSDYYPVVEMIAPNLKTAVARFKEEHKGWRKGFQYDLANVRAETIS